MMKKKEKVPGLAKKDRKHWIDFEILNRDTQARSYLNRPDCDWLMQEEEVQPAPCPVKTRVTACQECHRSKRKGRDCTKEGPSSGHHRQQTPRASPHLKVIPQHNLKPPHHFPAALLLTCLPLCLVHC